MLFPFHKSRGIAADAQPSLLHHRPVWGWEQTLGLAFPYGTPQLRHLQTLHPGPSVVSPPHPSSGPCRDRATGILPKVSRTLLFPQLHRNMAWRLTSPFPTVLSRTLSQDLREAYFSAEQRPAACAPHHPFPSAFWPLRTKSLWKAAGLRTPSPRSTWLRPLNDQLGMSHVSSPRLRNPARSLYTRLK